MKHLVCLMALIGLGCLQMRAAEDQEVTLRLIEPVTYTDVISLMTYRSPPGEREPGAGQFVCERTA